MISQTTIDGYVWQVKKILMQKYGCDTADRDIAPLAWYITTGRASIAFLHLLTDSKPYMIARKLHQAGSYDDALRMIKSYIDYREEN